MEIKPIVISLFNKSSLINTITQLKQIRTLAIFVVNDSTTHKKIKLKR